MKKDKDRLNRIRNYYVTIDEATAIDTNDGNFKVDMDKVKSLAQVFAENAVYEREQRGISKDSFIGRDGIQRFIGEERALCGGHELGEIEIKTGFDEQFSSALHRYFPKLDAESCVTVTVKGTFKGAECIKEKGSGFVAAASGGELPFQDHWVFSGDRVIYRYSDIGGLRFDTTRARPSLIERY